MSAGERVELARAARTRLERDGAGLEDLRRCDPEHRKARACPTASRRTFQVRAGGGG
jgi:hypothetical protein